MDDDSLELVRRRLIDEVQESVEQRFFRKYIPVVAVVVGALALFGYQSLSDIKAQVDEIAEQAKIQVEETVKDSVRDQMAKVTSEMDVLIRNVLKTSGSVELQLSQVEGAVSNVEKQLTSLEVDTDKLSELRKSVVALNEEREKQKEDIERLLDTRRDQQARLEAIQTETTKLSELTDKVIAAVGSADLAGGAAAAAIEDLKASVEQTKAYASEKAARTTVYLQFAGGKREKAVELSERLASQDFIMPGEERHSGAAGKREVRYYHAEDREAAERLVGATAQALAAMQYNPEFPEIRIRNLTDYKDAKPEPGILELWVEL